MQPMRVSEHLKGWHSRGYHSHLDAVPLVQSVTFRLHDSVPAKLIEKWRSELSMIPLASGEDRRMGNVTRHASRSRDAVLRKRIEEYEDSGHGECWLRDPRIAQIMQEALHHFNGERYHLLEWCVMPNHVHVLMVSAPGHSLSDVIRTWKTFTAREANRVLGRKGRFWMPDYFDRYVRDEHHLEAARQYIRRNPVKAGLCESEGQWRWSSAWARDGGSA